MSAPLRIDRVALLEESVRRHLAERDRRAREQEAVRARYTQTLRQGYAVRTPILRAAIEDAEEPYQAFLRSSEWARTVAALSSGRITPITTVDVPVEAGLRGWTLSFEETVVLTKRVHYMAPATTVLKVNGALMPVISWWQECHSIPQEPGSPLVSLGDRMTAYRTVLSLCLLLCRGRLLRVIQSAYLRRIRSSLRLRLAGEA